MLNGDFGTSPFYWQPSAGNGPSGCNGTGTSYSFGPQCKGAPPELIIEISTTREEAYAAPTAASKCCACTAVMLSCSSAMQPDFFDPLEKALSAFTGWDGPGHTMLNS
jgi:hypothetical protein